MARFRETELHRLHSSLKRDRRELTALVFCHKSVTPYSTPPPCARCSTTSTVVFSQHGGKAGEFGMFDGREAWRVYCVCGLSDALVARAPDMFAVCLACDCNPAMFGLCHNFRERVRLAESLLCCSWKASFESWVGDPTHSIAQRRDCCVGEEA